MAAGAALLAAVGLWMGSAAFACTVQAHLETRPGRADAGAVVRVEGSGFDLSGAPVDVWWGGEGGVLLARTQAHSGGFAVDVTIPTNALAGRSYQIEALQPVSPSYHGNAIFRIALPAAAAAPAASPAPAPEAHAVAAPQPTPAPAPAIQEAQGSPADLSGFSRAGTPAFAPGGTPVAPIDERTRGFGDKAHAGPARSPWVLLPLGLVGVALFTAGAASVVRQSRREGVRATI